MNALIRLLYAALIAAAVVAFVATGMFALYTPPAGPAFPLNGPNYTAEESQIAFDNYQKQQDTIKPFRQWHYRNVSIASLIIAVLIIAGGLVLLGRLAVIGEGLALGGIGTTIYAAGTAGMADQKILVFIATAVFLLGSLLVVERRFAGEQVSDKSVTRAARAPRTTRATTRSTRSRTR